MVKREIAFSSGLYHENIGRLLDVFSDRQDLVIVWELISGPDLLDLLNEFHGTTSCCLLRAVCLVVGDQRCCLMLGGDQALLHAAWRGQCCPLMLAAATFRPCLC
jgi:serine/threonine protein kinase